MHLLDHPLISDRYFFPRTGRPNTAVSVPVAGADLCCYRTENPTPDGPWLLHFHGNGEIAADWCHDFAPALEGRGVNVFLAEYRGYGDSTGRPALASMLDDALVVADAVGCPPDRLTVYGRSVGSLFALHVAAHRAVKNLIIESGIADMFERLALRVTGGELGVTDAELRAAVMERLDHRGKIEAFAGPVLILHARGDDLVTPDHARSLAEWAGDRATLELFAKGDHNSIHAYNGEAILDHIVALAT